MGAMSSHRVKRLARQVRLSSPRAPAIDGRRDGPKRCLLGDAMDGDATLFARQDVVENAWAIVDRLLNPHVVAARPVHAGELGTAGSETSRRRRRRMEHPGGVRTVQHERAMRIWMNTRQQFLIKAPLGFSLRRQLVTLRRMLRRPLRQRQQPRVHRRHLARSFRAARHGRDVLPKPKLVQITDYLLGSRQQLADSWRSSLAHSP